MSPVLRGRPDTGATHGNGLRFPAPSRSAAQPLSRNPNDATLAFRNAKVMAIRVSPPRDGVSLDTGPATQGPSCQTSMSGF
jgi:hypothetical protein